MKNLFKTLALVAVAAVGAVGCSDVGIEESMAPDATSGLTIYATVASAEQTKVLFTEDAESSAIALNWEQGDSFTLYEGDVVIDTFTTENGDGNFTSSDAELTLDEGTIYTAIYNPDADLANQNGDQIANLNQACQLVADFECGVDVSLNFAHTMAIMTFEFESDECPAKLVFENGDDIYTVSYSEIKPVGGLYTSHIMIEPCEEAERELTFSLYASDEATDAYDIRTVETSKAYEAGYRYTSPVSSLTNIMWSGSGSEDDPYQITSADDLRLLSTKVTDGTSYLDTYFELTQNIDLGGIAADGTITEANVWTAIGTSTTMFEGVFDGAGYEITGMYITTTGYYKGLFGYVSGATIKNLKVGGALSLSSGSYIATIVGYAISGSTIENCETLEGSTISTSTSSASYTGGVIGRLSESTVTGCVNRTNISGTSSLGGVVGGATYSSTIKNCYNNGTLTASRSNTGGLVGYLGGASTVVNCWNQGSVTITATGTYMGAGGLVGYCYNANIYNSYNIGAVKSGSKYIGGLVGMYSCGDSSSYKSYMYNCYTAGTVTGGSNLGALAGFIDYSIVYDCYYDITVSGSSTAAVNYTSINTDDDYGHITSKTTTQMQGQDFVDALNNGASLYNVNSDSGTKACKWLLNPEGYPTLDFEQEVAANTSQLEGAGSEADPYKLSSAADWVMLADFVNYGIYDYSDCYLKLTQDVDLGGIDDDGNGVVENEFKSIGSVINSFKGNFDGGSNTVEGLYINQPYMFYKALFGYVSSATIKNLSVSGSVTAYSKMGGIIGYASKSTITNCCNLCDVSGTSSTGGIVGQSYSTTIAKSCNVGSITGKYIGGIVGQHSSSSVATNCYNAGTITAAESASYVGGIIGYCSLSTATYCYNVGNIGGSANNLGGIAGYSYYGIDATNYWASDLENAPTQGASVYSGSDLSVPMAAADMQLSTFVDTLNSDQTDLPWKADYTTSPINNGYPILSWQ